MSLTALPAIVFDEVIDVSHHNGAIDWPAVAGAGIALAFIKATQGTGFVDPKFDDNRRAAAAAGVLVVPYHFLDAAEPARQAVHFLDATGLQPGQPAMIDWETAVPLLSVVTLGRAIIERCRRDPVVYHGFAQLQHADANLSRWPLMLPEYPRGNTSGRYRTLVKRVPRLPPGRVASWEGGQRPYDFHQYTPAGHVTGIATPVDRSIWVGSRAELEAWYAAATQPTATAPAAQAD
jgi:lysozyme